MLVVYLSFIYQQTIEVCSAVIYSVKLDRFLFR